MSPNQASDLEMVYLKPGELHVGEKPAKVVTVLGSCVSVTLFNKRLRMGAICHGALAHCRHKNGCPGLCEEAFRYVDCSVLYMISRFRDRKIADSEIEVKLFGGADTMASKKENSIGSMNVKMALEIIRREHLRLLAADVGDSFGRKLIFYTHTGEVFLKRLKDNATAQAANIQIPGVTFKSRGR